jgi:branched-subunit amino acid transport protein
MTGKGTIDSKIFLWYYTIGLSFREWQFLAFIKLRRFTMKKILAVLVLLGLLASLTVTASAEAPVMPSPPISLLASPRQWTSEYWVQNLGTGVAQVSATYYTASTGVSAGTESFTIPVGSSTSILPALSDGFLGSAVLSSDQEIAAVENHYTVDAGVHMIGASNGVATGSNALILPLITRHNSGFETKAYIQNLSSVQATIYMTFTPGLAGNSYSMSDTLPAYTMKAYDQSQDTPFAALGAKFVGSARVTADQPLAGAVDFGNLTAAGGFTLLITYDSLSSGAISLALPLIMKANNNFYTGQQIINTSNSTASVDIVYTAGPFSDASLIGQTITKHFDIPAYGSVTRILKDEYGCAYDDLCSWGNKKVVGSAVITSNQPVACVVNEQNDVQGFMEAYNGFSTAAATKAVAMPEVMKKRDLWYVGIQIQNMSGVATTATVTYTAGLGSTVPVGTQVVKQHTIGANSSFTIILLQRYGCTYDDLCGLGDITFSGAAYITADQNIVAIGNVQKDVTTVGDYVAAYNGLNR